MLSAEETDFLTAWATCGSSKRASSAESSADVEECSLPLELSRRDRSRNSAAWTREEHARFLAGLQLFPAGPWKAIADYIGTRTARQARTHAQKHKEKLKRRQQKLEHVRSRAVADTTSHDTTEEAPKVCRRAGIPWTPAEGERFREALVFYPQGPWRKITDHVGTRTIRQVMSYGRKYRNACTAASVESVAPLMFDCRSTVGHELPVLDEEFLAALECTELFECVGLRGD